MPNVHLQPGRIRGQRKYEATNGSVLLAAMLTILAAAGIIGALYTLSSTASRSSAGQEKGMNLEEFAKGAANMCSLLIDATLSVGNFSPPNTFTASRIFADTGMQVTFDPLITANPNETLYRELVVANPSAADPDWMSDLENNKFYPDIHLSNGRFEADIDIDMMMHEQPTGEGVEFGEAVQGQLKTVSINTYRCHAIARRVEDPGNKDDDRVASAFTYVRKEVGAN